MKKLNLFDKLLEFTLENDLGKDVLLFFAVLRIKHARRDFWRIDGLQKNRLGTSMSPFYEDRPSEFVCQDVSFSFSPFSLGQEYSRGIYFAQFWVAPNKLIAFLFTIDGITVKLKKHVVHDPTNKEVYWVKSYWSVLFWDDIEEYHQKKPVELVGHRVVAKYMIFPDDDEPLKVQNAIGLRATLSSKLVGRLQHFPARFRPGLLELIPTFASVGIDLHDSDSLVFFLFLSPSNIEELKTIAKAIRQHPSPTLMLVANDPDIDDRLMNTGHSYTLLHAQEVNHFSFLYFYRLLKNA